MFDYSNPQFPRELPRNPFGLENQSYRMPMLPQVIGVGLGQIPSGGFAIMGSGGFRSVGEVVGAVSGVGLLTGQFVMQSPTDQVKDF